MVQVQDWKREAVAEKMATTFKGLASFADFTQGSPPEVKIEEQKPKSHKEEKEQKSGSSTTQFGLVYRFEIHLPDTQNVDTFRAIFKALREELMQ